jgi:hypothetical protein
VVTRQAEFRSTRNAATGKRAKIKRLLDFALKTAERRLEAPTHSCFQQAFAKYLERYTFANFDPVTETGTAGLRRAIGHGAAKPES